MSTRTTIGATIERQLAALGTLQPDEIAARLGADGLRGKRGSPVWCPLGIALERAASADGLGRVEVWVDPPEVSVTVTVGDHHQHIVIPLPGMVVVFIAAFDAGRYPALVASS